MHQLLRTSGYTASEKWTRQSCLPITIDASNMPLQFLDIVRVEDRAALENHRMKSTVQLGPIFQVVSEGAEWIRTVVRMTNVLQNERLERGERGKPHQRILAQANRRRVIRRLSEDQCLDLGGDPT